MAKKLNYTHPSGTEYPESYWRIVKLVVDVPKRLATFVFYCYKDAAARAEGKEKVAEKIIHLDGDLFDQKLTEVTLKTKNPQEIGYEYCLLHRDQEATETIDAGLETERQEKTFVSFFADAEDC